MIEKITNMSRLMIQMKSQRLLNFIGSIEETDPFYVEMENAFTEFSKQNLPSNTAETLAMFKKEVGDEMFNSLASGSALTSILENWKTEKGIKAVRDFAIILKNKISEKLPDVTDDEALAVILVGILENQ